MRADICDPDDEAAVARFRTVLRQLGAAAADKSWGLGVDLWVVTIDGQEVRIFRDAWSLDIEGPEDVVKLILGRWRS